MGQSVEPDESEDERNDDGEEGRPVTSGTMKISTVSLKQFSIRLVTNFHGTEMNEQTRTQPMFRHK